MFIADQIDLTFQAIVFTGLLILPIWLLVFVALRKFLIKQGDNVSHIQERIGVSRPSNVRQAASAFSGLCRKVAHRGQN